MAEKKSLSEQIQERAKKKRQNTSSYSAAHTDKDASVAERTLELATKRAAERRRIAEATKAEQPVQRTVIDPTAIQPGRLMNFRGTLMNQTEKQVEQARKDAADRLLGQVGYKNIGGKAVFTSPFNPLPKNADERTATLHQAPGAYGIRPEDYVRSMQNISNYLNFDVPQQIEAPETDFVKKWFGDTNYEPSAMEMMDKADELEGAQLDEYYKDYDAYVAHRENVGANDQRQREYDREYENAKTAYEDAIKLLGEDAVNHLSENPADYYKRYKYLNAGHGENTDNWWDKLRSRMNTTEEISIEDAGRLNRYGDGMSSAPGGNERWSQTTKEERAMYKHLQELYGRDAAQSYIESLYPELDKRVAQEITQAGAEFAEEHPWRASIGSVANAPFVGLDFAGMQLRNLINGEANVYDPALNRARYNQAVRGTTEAGMGDVGKFLYGTAMSIGDNIANQMVWSPLGSTATALNMGFGSAAPTYIDVLERTNDPVLANMAAFGGGAAEMIFEKISLDNLIKLGDPGTIKTFVVNTLKQMGIEGSEELATGISTELYDRMLMGDQSNYEIAVRKYVDEGMSEDAARRLANQDSAGEIALGMAGGFISGGVTGGGRQGLEYLNARGRGNTQTNQPAQQTPGRTAVNVPAPQAAQETAGSRERETGAPSDELMAEYGVTDEQEQPSQQEQPVQQIPIIPRTQPAQQTQQPSVEEQIAEAARNAAETREREQAQAAGSGTVTQEEADRIMRRRNADDPERLRRVQERVAAANARASGRTAPTSTTTSTGSTAENRQSTESKGSRPAIRELTMTSAKYKRGKKNLSVQLAYNSGSKIVLGALDEKGRNVYVDLADADIGNSETAKLLRTINDHARMIGYNGTASGRKSLEACISLYDESLGTMEEYVKAFDAVMRASDDWKTAKEVRSDQNIMQHLSNEAFNEAYEAGIGNDKQRLEQFNRQKKEWEDAGPELTMESMEKTQREAAEAYKQNAGTSEGAIQIKSGSRLTSGKLETNSRRDGKLIPVGIRRNSEGKRVVEAINYSGNKVEVDLRNAFFEDETTQELLGRFWVDTFDVDEQRGHNGIADRISDEALPAYVDGYQPENGSIAKYAKAFYAVYKGAERGKSMQAILEADETIASHLSEETMEAAYQTGSNSPEAQNRRKIEQIHAQKVAEANKKALEAKNAKTEAEKTEPAKTEPAKTEPAKTEPAKAEPEKAQPAKAEPEKAQPAKAEPEKAETAETEKAEPEKAEPAARQKTQKLSTQQTATYVDENGDEHQVRVVGVESVEDGMPVLRVLDENGEDDFYLASDLSFGNEMDELLSYDGIARMDPKALRNYLEGYDQRLGTAKQYARAYNAVYQRGVSGVSFEQAYNQSGAQKNYISKAAATDAYAAGLNAYSAKHDTVEAADMDFGSGAQAVKGNASLSAQEGRRRGRISKNYKQSDFDKLGAAGQKNAIAQIELMRAFISRTGHTIVIDPTIVHNGTHANAYYDRDTHEVHVALDAVGGAYAYAAAHELTHALRNEHSEAEWNDFADFVKETLTRNGQSWADLVRYQMDHLGYDRAQAEEEVICNTVPAMLQDESNILKIYKGNRTLFERIVDWVRGMLKDIKAAGDALAGRSPSWKQMDALKNDRQALQEMYDRMMTVMEKGAEKQQTKQDVKLSSKEEGYYDYSKSFAEQVEDLRAGRFPEKNALLVSGTPEVLQKIGFSNLPLMINQDHLMRMERDTEHYLSKEMIRQLPELLKDPVAVITSTSEGSEDSSIVMILKAIVNGKPYIAPVYITSESRTYNARIDSNNIATVFRKGNAVSKLLEDAVQKENADKIGVYYWKKTEARNLFEGAGVQFSGSSIQDGLIHSIHDAGSPVNRKYMEQTETKQFKRWFGNSQIVNEDGTPKVVYHGTATEFWTFDKKKANDMIGRRMGLGAGKDKFYLTEHKGSGNAAAYSAQGAGKGNQPKVMELYVSAQKVMDRSEYDRRLKELFAKYPNSDPRGAAYDYRQRDKAIAQLDKAIRKEGYDGVWDKDSGELFVYDSTQIKSATDNVGTFDPQNPDIRFSMQDTVEETRDLLAVHNLTEENLRNAMELGGLAMPSIAVIKAEQGHSQYGAISVIFDKNTIDPQASRDNEIYGGDAWTPTFPRVEYEADSKAEKRLSDKYYELRQKAGDDAARVLYRYATDLQEELNRNGGASGIVKRLMDDTNAMQLYLADSGKETIKPITKTVVERISEEQRDTNGWIISTLGEDEVRRLEQVPEGMKAGDHRRAWVKENAEAIRDIFAQLMVEKTGDPELAKMVAANLKSIDLLNMGRNALDQLNGKTEKTREVQDYLATERAIRDAVDSKEYTKWLTDLFAGSEKRKGIRNGADPYTPSGNRRSFSATHWDITLDNVVRAMRKEEKTGVGTFGRNIEGAAVKKYGSIADVKADSGRLGRVDEAEYDAMRREFKERFSDIAQEYAGSDGDEFDAGDTLVEYITKNATADGIYKQMAKDAAFYEPSKAIAEKLAELVDEMKNAPTGYFEAKPRRAVGFDEMAAVIVPDNLSMDVKTSLEDAGVNVIEYEAGNEADRLSKMNGPDVNRLMFSLRDTDENVQSAMTAEQKAFEQVKGHRITAAEADKVAGDMLKAANSDYDRQTLAAELSRTIDYIERGEDVDWNQVDDELTAIAARVMEKSKTINLEHEEMAKPIRDYLRKTSIRLTDAQRKEAESMSGSFSAYRKGMFGRVRLASVGGTPLDSLWAELSAMNSELFPADAGEGEQARLLVEAVDALKPMYENNSGMNMEESATWLAGKMNESYFNLPTVKAAARSSKTFGEAIIKLKDALKRFEETSWTDYQSALRSIQEARGNELRTKKQQETAAMRQKYSQWREKDASQRKEREMRTKYRTKVERTAQTLLNWLDKPTDAKHVPAGVEDSVRRMLASLDFSGKSTKSAKDLSAQLNLMADALQNAQEGEDENRTMFLERDQQMIDEIKRVAELIRGNSDYEATQGRGVYDLNGLELKELSKWLGVVKHVLTKAGTMRGSNLPGSSVEEVAVASMMEIGRKKAHKDKKWITKQWNNMFGPDMQDSFTFFERLGPTTNAVFKGLRQGFDKMAGLVADAEKRTQDLLDGADLKHMTGKHAKKQTFQLESGTVELTKAQIMEMYVLSKREQAQGHLYGRGFRLQDDENARPYTISKAELNAITSTLTEDEKRIADGMQKFLSKECANWGNQASMQLLGYRKFGEENYWPISTDSNSLNTTKLDDNSAANISAIKNQGMTKQTVEGAKNAIVIGDIFDTYTRHISNMAAYSAYALPLSDFTRWYNSRGVKTEIEHVLGKDGLKYINNFLMAVNGTAAKQEKSGLSDKMGALTRNAKIASVGANARVVIQQPTSYARAAMYISPKYLSEALVMRKPDEDLVNKYCAIAQWKRWGFYETNVGPNLRQLIVGDASFVDKTREWMMKPAAKGDEWTLNHLWNACEMETREVYPELKRGSDEYYKQVGARMSEIIDRTQVVDSVFHRSQMMRSKNAMNQMLTNFMAEPTKTYNMLAGAISEYAENRKNKAARNRLARAFAVYGVTGIMTAAAAAVVDAFRDDDDEKEWLEKYTDALKGNTVDNLNPLGMLPVVKDVLSMLEGFEASRLDLQSIQKLINVKDTLAKAFEEKSKLNPYGVTYKIAQALSSLFGIPVSNIMRDVNAIYQNVTGYNPTLNAVGRKNTTVNKLYDAMSGGKKADAQELRKELKEKVGMSEKEIDTALAEKLMTDPKVIEAWTAKSEKRFADANRAHNALTAKGFSADMVDKAILKYGDSVTPKEAKEKDPNEQLSVTLYSNEEVASAIRIIAGVERGGSVTEADVRTMISERVAGSGAADPEKDVRSDVQSELKKDYLAMAKAGDSEGMRKLGAVMTSVLGTTQETMDKWIVDQHADDLRTAVGGYDLTAAAKAVTVMRRDGKTDSQIKSTLSSYKQTYIDAVNSGDNVTAGKIKRTLMGLGLTGKNGKALYTNQTFIDWLQN